MCVCMLCGVCVCQRLCGCIHASPTLPMPCTQSTITHPTQTAGPKCLHRTYKHGVIKVPKRKTLQASPPPTHTHAHTHVLPPHTHTHLAVQHPVGWVGAATLHGCASLPWLTGCSLQARGGNGHACTQQKGPWLCQPPMVDWLQSPSSRWRRACLHATQRTGTSGGQRHACTQHRRAACVSAEGPAGLQPHMLFDTQGRPNAGSLPAPPAFQMRSAGVCLLLWSHLHLHLHVLAPYICQNHAALAHIASGQRPRTLIALQHHPLPLEGLHGARVDKGGAKAGVLQACGVGRKVGWVAKVRAAWGTGVGDRQVLGTRGAIGLCLHCSGWNIHQVRACAQAAARATGPSRAAGVHCD